MSPESLPAQSVKQKVIVQHGCGTPGCEALLSVTGHLIILLLLLKVCNNYINQVCNTYINQYNEPLIFLCKVDHQR